MLGLTVWNMGGGGRPEGWSLGTLLGLGLGSGTLTLDPNPTP